MTDSAPLLERGTGLDQVFHLVREREGVDLRSYRRKTVERRVTSRLQKLHCRDYEEYAIRLAEDPNESQRLVEHVTIKVSRFFRDTPVYARLREEVLPDLVQRNGSEGELRIWSAGCGNGEEAYSLAILVEEIARQGRPGPKTTIWGTDIDEGALAAAGRGLYPEETLVETPPDLVTAYFSRQKGRFGPQYEVLPCLRERVRYLHHDLLSEVTAPGGHPFDLVLCRNVLIYFERPAQERVFRLLAASVNQGGYLCLGEAEQPTKEHQSDFEAVNRQARLYRKVQSMLEGEGKHVA